MVNLTVILEPVEAVHSALLVITRIGLLLAVGSMEAMDSYPKMVMKTRMMRIPNQNENISMKKMTTKRLTMMAITRITNLSGIGMDSRIWKIRGDAQESKHLAVRLRWTLAACTMRLAMKMKKKMMMTRMVSGRVRILLEAIMVNLIKLIITSTRQTHLDSKRFM